MKVSIDGLNAARRELNRLQRRMKELDGRHLVPIEELLTPDFMRANTRFSSFDDMVESSPFEVASTEDFEAIPDDEWDAYVANTTNYASWEAMLGEAAQEWAARQLGLEE